MGAAELFAFDKIRGGGAGPGFGGEKYSFTLSLGQSKHTDKVTVPGPRFPGDLTFSLIFRGFSKVFFGFRNPGDLISRPCDKIRTVQYYLL